MKAVRIIVNILGIILAWIAVALKQLDVGRDFYFGSLSGNPAYYHLQTAEEQMAFIRFAEYQVMSFSAMVFGILLLVNLFLYFLSKRKRPSIAEPIAQKMPLLCTVMCGFNLLAVIVTGIVLLSKLHAPVMLTLDAGAIKTEVFRLYGMVSPLFYIPVLEIAALLLAAYTKKLSYRQALTMIAGAGLSMTPVMLFCL